MTVVGIVDLDLDSDICHGICDHPKSYCKSIPFAKQMTT